MNFIAQVIISLFIIGLSAIQISSAATKDNTSLIKMPIQSPSQEEDLAVPDSLLLPSPISFIFPEHMVILAPQRGTQMSLSLNHSSTEDSDYGFIKTLKIATNVSTLSIAHAFNSNFYIGADLNYIQQNTAVTTGIDLPSINYSSKSNLSTQSSGVSDPILSIGGRINSKDISTILSLGVKIKTGDSVSESSSSGNSTSSSGKYTRTTGNVKSGGSAIIPSVTIFSNSKSNALIGATFSYQILQDRTSVTKSTIDESETSYSTSKSSKGNRQSISAFIESPESKISFGGSLNYYKIESTTDKSDDSERESDSFSLVGAIGFLKIKASKNLALIPSISLVRNAERNDQFGLNNAYTVGVAVKSRF